MPNFPKPWSIIKNKRMVLPYQSNNTSTENLHLHKQMGEPSVPTRDATPHQHSIQEIKEFERNAHAMVDFIGQYYRQLYKAEQNVQSSVSHGYLLKALPSSGPQEPVTFEELMLQVHQHILPGVTHWQHPQFFGWFPSLTSFPSMLADMLCSAFNVQAFSWISSPAATELEILMLDWLAKATGLPSEFLSNGAGGGSIQVSASDSILVALLAARQRCLIAHDRFDEVAMVGDSSQLVAYGSSQTHSSFMKSAKCAGVRVHLIPTKREHHYALNVADLVDAIKKDKANGFIPFFVCGTVGTTSTTAVDPIQEMAYTVRTTFPEDTIWLHVDAAYAGTFSICEEFRHYLDGLELFDSYTFNPHKTMRIGFDCSAFYVKEKQYVFDSLAFVAEYLRNTDRETLPDFKDWQTSLGRRFRSLKLFFVFSLLGINGIQSHIRGVRVLAQRLAAYLNNDENFEIIGKCQFGLVCFRLKNYGNRVQEKLLKGIVESNFLLTHTKLDGEFVLRVCVGSPTTTATHIDALWKAIKRSATLVALNNDMAQL